MAASRERDFTAFYQARRRRKVVATAGAVAAVAVIAAGGVLAAGTLGGSERPASFAGPPTASPEPPAKQKYPAAAFERYKTLQKTLTSVPGWDVSGWQGGTPPLLAPCGVRFGKNLGGVGSAENAGLFRPPGPLWLPINSRDYGFGIPASAPDAMEQIIANLLSCTRDSWRTQPIAQTGAALVFTDRSVVWILNKNAHVRMLQVPTADGLPPLAVQVEVANQMYSWIK